MKNKTPIIGGAFALLIVGSIIGLGMIKPYSTKPLPHSTHVRPALPLRNFVLEGASQN
jgi:hypothetical protein